MNEDMLFLFELGDADALIAQIRNVRSNPDLVKEKLRRAQQFTMKMNWEVEKPKLVNLVDSILATSFDQNGKKSHVN